MKKNLWLLALSLMLPVSLFAQDASKELVSKQLADAISSGKFYMKIGGDFSAEGMRVKFVTEMAMKGDVVMNRMEMTGMNNVVLCTSTASSTHSYGTFTTLSTELPGTAIIFSSDWTKSWMRIP